MSLLYGTHSRWYIGNTDPASDPINSVRDGKGWIKTTSDNPPWGGIIAVSLRDNGAWEPFPFGSLLAGALGQTIPGRDGEDGEQGFPGRPGRDGADGVVGRDGVTVIGQDGDDGERGYPGRAGRDGLDGRDGRPGFDGQDGDDYSWPVPGPQGLQGTPGPDGTGPQGIAGPALFLPGDDGDEGPRGPVAPVGAGQSVLLFDQTLTADTATVDVTGIPAGFNILEIFVYGRTDEAVTQSAVYLQFNGDTGTNYPRQYIGALNTTANIGSDATLVGVAIVIPGSSDSASTFGSYYINIPAYSQTTAFKSIVATGGFADTTASRSALYNIATIWRNTAAINRITFVPLTAAKKLVAGTRITIYGR